MPHLTTVAYPALIAFDLDGTLVDSRRDLAAATNALLVECGAAPLSDEAVGDLVGEGAAVLVRRALSTAGLDPERPGALASFLRLYDERLLETTRAYDGMVEVLETLQASFRLAVLTNKPERATLAILDGLDLRRFFVDVIGGDSPFGRKPEPAGLLELARRATMLPTRTLLVGDSPIDVETATRAGTRLCVARYGFGYRAAQAAAWAGAPEIDRPEELLSMV